MAVALQDPGSPQRTGTVTWCPVLVEERQTGQRTFEIGVLTDVDIGDSEESSNPPT